MDGLENMVHLLPKFAELDGVYISLSTLKGDIKLTVRISTGTLWGWGDSCITAVMDKC